MSKKVHYAQDIKKRSSYAARKAADALLHKCGYWTRQTTCTRPQLIALLFIAVNQLSALKQVHPYRCYKVLFVLLSQMLQGQPFTPEKVRKRWLHTVSNGEDVREAEDWKDRPWNTCPCCGQPHQMERESMDPEDFCTAADALSLQYPHNPPTFEAKQTYIQKVFKKKDD